MGSVNLTNLVGSTITILEYEINKYKMPLGSKNINFPNTLFTFYNEKKWDEFSDIIIKIQFNGAEYKVDLNKDHYFKGDGFQYPGEGSDIDIIFFGTNESGSQIQLRLAYRGDLANYLKSTDDYKYMDKQVSS